MDSPANKKWLPEIVKHLISLYELQPLLYNINSMAYHNKMSRNVAIETIANELQLRTKQKFTTEEVLKKINSLRTQFLNVERSKKKGEPSGSGSTAKPAWWLYEHLQFLQPFTKKDRSDSNLLNRTTESSFLEESNLDDISIIEPDEQVHLYTISPSSGMLSPETGPSRTNSPCLSVSSQEQHSSRTLKRKRNAREIPGREDILRESLQKIVEEKEDPIDLFTAWVGSELKSLKDKKILKTVKRKIITVIEAAQDEDEIL